MNAATSRLLILYALIALVAIVYWPSTAALARLWTDYDNLGYTHGPMVAAVSLWLMFVARRKIGAAKINPAPAALVALLMSSLAWLVFYRAGILGLHLALLPLLIWLAAYAIFGWPVARQLIFALGFLYFGLTVLDRLTGVLQSLTVHVVGLLLALAGVPAQITGNHVAIPEGAFVIADGCSGHHYFVVGLALAALWGELGRDSLRRRAGLIVLMAGLALLANWMRVFIIIMAGHLSHMQHPLIRQHYFFGWALFGVTVAIFFLIARWLSSAPRAAPAPESLSLSTTPVSVPTLVGTALLLVAAPASFQWLAPAQQSVDRVAAAVGRGLRASILTAADSGANAAAASPKDLPEARKLLSSGLHSLRDGDYAHAESQLRDARRAAAGSLPPPLEATLIAALVESCLAQRKVVPARAAQQDLERLIPDSPATKLLGARVLLAQGDTLGGIAQLQRLVVEKPDYLQARVVLGEALMARGSVMQAQSQFIEALRIAPNNRQVQALKSEAQLLALDPGKLDNPVLLNNLAWLYYLRGDARAEQTARRAYQLAPAEPAIADTYGWVLLSRNQVDQAMPLLEKAARAVPDNADIGYHYGVALARSGRREEATAVLQRLMATHSTFTERDEARKLLAELEG